MFLNNYIFEKKEHNTVNLCYIITPTSWIYKNMEPDDCIISLLKITSVMSNPFLTQAFWQKLKTAVENIWTEDGQNISQ